MDRTRETRPPSSTSRAEALFLDWIRRTEQGAGEPFDELRAAHADLADALTRLQASYEQARATLARLGARPLTSASPPRPESATPARYEIRSEIARGGMGVILEVYEPALRRTLAMKRLRGFEVDGWLERLHRERRPAVRGRRGALREGEGRR